LTVAYSTVTPIKYNVLLSVEVRIRV
jgi:hypothetical protein